MSCLDCFRLCVKRFCLMRRSDPGLANPYQASDSSLDLPPADVLIDSRSSANQGELQVKSSLLEVTVNEVIAVIDLSDKQFILLSKEKVTKEKDM